LESENERLNKSDTSKEESSIEYYNLYKDLKRKNKDLNELCELQRVSIAESFVRENQLKDRIAELEKRCHFIWALGYDYDGCEKAESLKSLIDELVGIAQGNWGDVCSKCENKQDNLINDKLKQFAEMLKKKKVHIVADEDDRLEIRGLGIFVTDIDETLKETIGENCK
jgi:hypothetical protein